MDVPETIEPLIDDGPYLRRVDVNVVVHEDVAHPRHPFEPGSELGREDPMHDEGGHDLPIGRGDRMAATREEVVADVEDGLDRDVQRALRRELAKRIGPLFGGQGAATLFCPAIRPASCGQRGGPDRHKGVACQLAAKCRAIKALSINAVDADWLAHSTAYPAERGRGPAPARWRWRSAGRRYSRFA